MTHDDLATLLSSIATRWAGLCHPNCCCVVCEMRMALISQNRDQWLDAFVERFTKPDSHSCIPGMCTQCDMARATWEFKQQRPKWVQRELL